MAVYGLKPISLAVSNETDAGLANQQRKFEVAVADKSTYIRNALQLALVSSMVIAMAACNSHRQHTCKRTKFTRQIQI
jgi:hypothetical protein